MDYIKEIDDIVNILSMNNQTVSVMESCTGGFFANLLTNVSGASKVFKFGAVTYSNEFKIKMGVSKGVIDKNTVYSTETAMDMARSIAFFTSSNYGIGITGKLGSADSFNKGKSNREVYFSIYDKDKDRYYNSCVEVINSSRVENKKQVIEMLANKFYEIIKED